MADRTRRIAAPGPGNAPAPGASAPDTPADTIEARLRHAGLPPLPRTAWLEVDLDTLARNVRVLRELLPTAARLAVVVKADGYGTGIEGAARAAIRGGAELLVVATLDEAQRLRAAGQAGRVLVLYPVAETVLADAVALDLDLVAADEGSLAALESWLAARGPADPLPRVHLAVDSGMGRGGFDPAAVPGAARRLLGAGLPALAGTWSHLATPEDPAAVAGQVDAFERALAGLRAAGIDPGIRHLDATGGLLTGTGPAYDLVRVGLAAYGVHPPELSLDGAAARAAARLRPAVALRARAATVSHLAAGASVGYGGTWTATRASRIATLPIGYADGWARAYAGGSWGVVRGVRVPAVGRISSDALAVDVTEIPGFDGRDVVTLLDPAEPLAMTVHDLAVLRGSIAWEVLDALSPRLSRVYLEEGRLAGTRYLDGMARFVTTR